MTRLTRFLLGMLMFMVSNAISAQKINVTGTVTDSLARPLGMANVVAINQETKVLDGFGITSDKGMYKISVKANAKYSLKVSYLGFESKQILITTLETDLANDFTLNEQVENLDGVEITYEMPVVVKGDTIEYNADSFATGTEKKLEDVLKNLPGVEVSDDGEIEVEGKTVGKVMVEGKDFFDGDSKLASKNIPANALDKIQILKNFDEVGQLKSVRDNQDSYAINIKLKEGKKNFWFGEVTMGVGNEERYIAHPKLFYYSPKSSINIITNLNNTGEVPFTRRDYFRFTGGFRGVGSNSGTNFNVGSSDMGFLSLQNNKALDITSKFGAVNFSQAPKKTWDLSGFAIYSGNRTVMKQNSSIDYVQAENGIVQGADEETESKTSQKSDLGLLKLSSSYKPNADNHFDYDFFGRISKQSQDRDVFSSLTGAVDEVQKQDPFSINQNLNYYYTLDAKNIFALEVQHLLQEEDPFYSAALTQSEQFRFSEILGLDNSQSGYNVNQDKLVKTHKFDAKLDYWYVLGTKSNIKFTLGSLLSSQKFNSEIFQILDTGNIFSLSNAQESVENDIKYNLSDLYLGIEYRLKAGIFTFTPSVSVHNYTTKNVQSNALVKNNFIRFLPNFNTRMQLKNSEDLNFRYSMQTNFSDVNQFAEALVFNNYNSLFQGNRELENALSHNVNLRYNNFNMFNFSNIRGSINYSKRVDQVRSMSQFFSYPDPNDPTVTIQTANRVSSPFNSNFADETFSVNGSYNRTFGKIKAGVGANMSYSKFNQFINGLQLANESYTTSYRTSLGTRFLNAPNIEFGYRLSVNDYKQGATPVTYYTHTPTIKVDAQFLKSFIFNVDYAHHNYKRDNESLNNYTFLNASLGYQKKDSKWEYILKATNLADTKSLNQDSINTLSVSTSEYFIQPRYITLKVRYNL